MMTFWRRSAALFAIILLSGNAFGQDFFWGSEGPNDRHFYYAIRDNFGKRVLRFPFETPFSVSHDGKSIAFLDKSRNLVAIRNGEAIVTPFPKAILSDDILVLAGSNGDVIVTSLVGAKSRVFRKTASAASFDFLFDDLADYFDTKYADGEMLLYEHSLEMGGTAVLKYLFGDKTSSTLFHRQGYSFVDYSDQLFVGSPSAVFSWQDGHLTPIAKFLPQIERVSHVSSDIIMKGNADDDSATIFYRNGKTAPLRITEGFYPRGIVDPGLVPKLRAYLGLN